MLKAKKPKKRRSLKIVLKLEGPDSEKGLIRLDYFLAELTALRQALTCVDKDINKGKNTLYYRIVGLSQNSPATVTIEPVLRPGFKTKAQGNRYGHNPENVQHTFFKTIKAIQNRTVPDIGEPVIDAIADLLNGLGSEFKECEIANGKSKINLDGDFKELIEGLLKPQYQSFGSVEGELLAINLAHGRRRFYIYPEVGPSSVSCIFPAQLEEQAQASIRKHVRIYGVKHYRAATGLPFKITDVQKIEPLGIRTAIPAFSPTGGNIEGPSADEVIKDSREELE